MAISYADIARTTPHEVLLINQIGSQITFQRNQLVRRALEFEADAIYWQDSDIVAPAETLDELLSHRKEIVGCVYCAKVPPHDMVGTIYRTPGRLKKAAALAGGCILVDTEVYRKLGWPWYFEKEYPEVETLRSEDISFCFKAREHGYEIWCDSDLSQRIAHLGSHAYVMKFPPEEP